jgi:hypothetical protein
MYKLGGKGAASSAAKSVDAINSIQKTRDKTAPIFTLNNYM